MELTQSSKAAGDRTVHSGCPARDRKQKMRKAALAPARSPKYNPLSHTAFTTCCSEEIGHIAKTPRPQVQQHRAVEAGAHLPPTSAEGNTVQINGEEKGLK